MSLKSSKINSKKCFVAFVFALLLLSCIIGAAQATPSWTPTTIDTTGSVGQYSSIAIGPNGNPQIAYYDGTSGNLLYAIWDGYSWTIQVVDAGSTGGSDVGAWASIAVDSNNNPHISYFADGSHYLKYAEWNGSSWAISTVAGGTLATYVGEHSAIALDSLGNPHICFYNYTSGEMQYATLVGSSWTIETIGPVSGPSGYLASTFNSIAVNKLDNTVYISYYNQTSVMGIMSNDLWCAKKSGGIWTAEKVASDGNVGMASDIAIDSSGKPHISFYNDTRQDLEYASWTGALWKIEKAASQGIVGRFNSLAIDAGDKPHISFYNNTGQSLGYSTFDGLTWQTALVDNAGNVGEYCSIAVDLSGKPHISYFDETNENLKCATFGGLFILPESPFGALTAVAATLIAAVCYKTITLRKNK